MPHRRPRMLWLRSVAAASVAVAALLGTTAPDPASAARLRVRPLWARLGTGLVADLAVADLGGPGAGLVVGGRGVGAVGDASLLDGRFQWANKWEGSEASDDSDVTQEISVADVNADGVDDAMVANGEAVYAMDGSTGRTLWRAVDEGPGFSPGAWELATADYNGDGVADAAFGNLVDDRITAVDGRDGSRIWYYPKDGIVLNLATGDLDLDGRPDVVVIGQADFPSQFEVHAISGSGVQQGQASSLWLQHFPAPGGGGDPTVVAIGQVDAITSSPEVVVGGSEGKVSVLDGTTGDPIASASLPGGIGDVELLDVDGDLDLEILTANDRPFDAEDGTVDAFDADGTRLWRLPTPGPVRDLQVADLDGGGTLEVVAAGGWQGDPPPGLPEGFAVAFDPHVPTPRVAWTVGLPEWASKAAFGPLFGDRTVAVGQGQEGGVWGLDTRGRKRWFFRTGGRVEEVAAADLDGNGVPEVIEGADDSSVAVSDADGRLEWTARVPGRSGPDVISVAAGDLLPTVGLEVVAGTIEFDLVGPGGMIHAYSRTGTSLWSADALGWVDQLLIDDLESDGKSDVVIATSTDGSAARFDRAGKRVWEISLSTGLHASMSLLDANGDGTRDLIVGSKALSGGDLYAIDGRTGDELWHVPVAVGLNWVSTTGQAEDGITAGDLAGSVFRFRASDGSQVWATGQVGSSWDGMWSVDANGDGTRDVASVFEDGNARMLDGADGHELWVSPSDGQPGLVVTTLVGGGRRRVVMGTYGTSPISSSGIFVVDAVTGRRIGSGPTFGMVLDVTPANLDGDRPQELLAGAGWQVHAIDVG